MGVEFEEKLTKGLEKIKKMEQGSQEYLGELSTLELLRVTQMRDILVKAYGDKKLIKEFDSHLSVWGIVGYLPKHKGYTRDYIYMVVKELEFRKESDSIIGGGTEGYDELLELYSEVFNHWESYEKLLEGEEEVIKKKEPKTRAERKDLGL